MRTTYYDEDDILVIRFSDKLITREVSQDWNTHISYAEDGTTVEIVLLDAKANGFNRSATRITSSPLPANSERFRARSPCRYR